MKKCYKNAGPLFAGLILSVFSATGIFSQELKPMRSPLLDHKEAHLNLDSLVPEDYVEKFIFNYRLDHKNEFEQNQKYFIIPENVFNAMPLSIREFILANKVRYSKNFNLNGK